MVVKEFTFGKFPPPSLKDLFFCAIVNDGQVVATLPHTRALGDNWRTKFLKYLKWAFHDPLNGLVVCEEGQTLAVLATGHVTLKPASI